MKQLLESQAVIRQILRWKLHLIVIGIITVALAILFSSSLFITPLFKSKARIYPINIKAFSEESESEQMLEVVSSTDLKRKMVEVFNLKKRYGISPDDRFAQTNVLQKYDEYVSSSKTRYETIELQVMDSEPEVASAMVDSLITFYNAKMLEMRKAKYADELLGYQNDLRRKQAEIDSLNNQMEVFRKEYGILDYESQTLQLTLGYAEVLARGAARSSVDDLQKRLALLGDKGGEFLLMQSKMQDLEKQREEIGTNLEEVQSLMNREENFALVVEEPFPADKKSYPTRWIILLASLISVEFLAVLFILLFDRRETSKS